MPSLEECLKVLFPQVGDCFLCEHRNIHGAPDTQGNFICMWCWDTDEADEKGHYLTEPHYGYMNTTWGEDEIY